MTVETLEVADGAAIDPPVRVGNEAEATLRRLTLPIAAAVVLATIAILRATILAGGDAPPGFDGGNWLAYGDALLGRSVKPEGVAYPPLVPLLSAAAVHTLGPTVGISILGGVASILPAVGVFVVLSAAGLGVWALALAAMVAVLPSSGAVASWGGYPQLVAAPLALLAYLGLDAWLRTGARRALLVFGCAMLLILATSHYVALVAVTGSAIVIAARLATARARAYDVLRRAGVATGVAVVSALPVAIVYARLVPAILRTRGTGADGAATFGLEHLPAYVVAVFGVSWPIVVVGLVAALLAIVVARSAMPWAVLCAVTIAAALTYAVTREPRVVHELGVVAALGVGAIVLRVRGTRWWRRVAPAVAVLLAVGVLVGAVAGARDARSARRRFSVLDPPAAAALAWVRTHTPIDAVVASSGYHGAPIGWWVEGLADRRSLSAIEPHLLVFPEERRDAATARRLLWRLGASPARGFEAARAAGVDYLLVPVRSEAARALGIPIDSGDLVPAYRNERFLILEIPPASADDPA